MGIHSIILVAITSLLSVSVHAFPIAKPGTEGFGIFTTSTDSVIATYQGNSASYSNDLYLMLDGSRHPGNDGNTANDLFIFNNHASPVGSNMNIGSFTAGTELFFRIHVNNTGNDFFTGAAAGNADGQFHARVEENWQPNTTLVSFEDLYDPSGNSSVFNDLSFSFSNTSNTSVVPEPETYAMFLAGLSIIGALAGRRKKTS
ncbi:PEP-CTERM protein-sorting domain-containing protein [Nitrosospira sp. Nsp18]|uniref:PEP-CTERM sorting domain-containing protein n=1 Tax=Nitrosospira sp. Nsp18 TaxID=1855334 RepID=UPI000891025B|nr:PEP-CTERM sorting domain-containing protein [Nitrosospira sp. Nsp18]SDA10875.1 PEP-CTERM protein-sorting domain-containing protein [Nitrosospira sp. Nsp18]